MKNLFFCDAHAHLSHVKDLSILDDNYFVCSSFHFIDEFENFNFDKFNVLCSFGIHPENVDFSLKDYILSLAENKKIDAIGECGFDLFEEKYRLNLDNQVKAFDFQLQVAIKYQLPLILHVRKAMNLIFERCQLLKKVSSVVFHSSSTTLIEANSFIKKGINCFFSFGKPLLNGKKSALECVKNIESSRILLETDSPYQTLKGESDTKLSDIKKVYQKAAELKNLSFEELQNQIYRNFKQAFLLC